MAGTWLLFFLILVVCMAVVAFTVQQRSWSQQLEAGRFRMLVRRMRALDAELADFDAEFATKFESTSEAAVAAANGSMDDVQAKYAEAAKRTRLSADMSTRLVNILNNVKTNYEDMEALASKLSAEEQQRMYRLSELMRGRHAELASRIKDDGLTEVVDVVAEGFEPFTSETGLRRIGVEISETDAAHLDAATDFDMKNGLTLKESLYLQLSEMPSVLARAKELVVGKPESPVYRMLRDLRTSNAAGLSLLRTQVGQDANTNNLLSEFAAVGAGRAATSSAATAAILEDLRKSFGDLSVKQSSSSIAQAADETAAAAALAAKVKNQAIAAAAAAKKDQTLSAAAKKTASDWAVVSSRQYLAAALKAEDAAVREEKTVTLLAAARAAASESATAESVDRYKRVSALWNKTPFPWDKTPMQQGLIEYLSDSSRVVLACALHVRLISQAHTDPLFKLKCIGAVPDTEFFWADEHSVLSSKPGGLGSKVDMWSGGNPIQVVAWFDQSGKDNHAVFVGGASEPPSLTLYGNMAVNVTFGGAKGLKLPDGALSVDGATNYVVSVMHGTAAPGASFFRAKSSSGAGYAIGVDGEGMYHNTFGPEPTALKGGTVTKGANVVVSNGAKVRNVTVNDVKVAGQAVENDEVYDKDLMIGGVGAEFTLNRLYLVNGRLESTGDYAELTLMP